MSKGDRDIVIMPVIEGQTRRFFTGGVRCRRAGRGLFTAGTSLALFGVAASTLLTGLGTSMLLGGVVKLMTPQPNYGVGKSSSADNKPNYAFGAPVNTVAMDYPVPVLYGQREIGGAVISAGVFASDQQ